jgi:hypothetical protein
VSRFNAVNKFLRYIAETFFLTPSFVAALVERVGGQQEQVDLHSPADG